MNESIFSHSFIEVLESMLKARNCSLKWINSQWRIEKGEVSVALIDLMEGMVLHDMTFDQMLETLPDTLVPIEKFN